MLSQTFESFDTTSVPSPCFVIDVHALENNLKILAKIQKDSGAKILLALKAFSCWHLGPLISTYLNGVCASGLHEAFLARDHYDGELHVYSPAYSESDFLKISSMASHIVFNSKNQLERFCKKIFQAKAESAINLPSFGLRINPEYSEGSIELYDPCAEQSRLGITLSELEKCDLTYVEGFHFHTLCEQGADVLERTLAVFEDKFASYLKHIKWLNFGGGHHITKPDYDRHKLVELIQNFSKKYDLNVYLEPGEAIAIHSGVLISEVLDIGDNKKPFAILDTSATCHMPDTLEMPYRAHIKDSGVANERAYTYRLGGVTCLAGDVMGDYSFDTPLKIGQRVMFDDMAHYTMVKATTFNGVALPAIAIWDSQTDECKIIKVFSYEDYKSRLG